MLYLGLIEFIHRYTVGFVFAVAENCPRAVYASPVPENIITRPHERELMRARHYQGVHKWNYAVCVRSKSVEMPLNESPPGCLAGLAVVAITHSGQYSQGAERLSPGGHST